jgi:hypothetical protein
MSLLMDREDQRSLSNVGGLGSPVTLAKQGDFILFYFIFNYPATYISIRPEVK